MWDDILRLLAIAVLADHRLRDPELIEFCHEAQTLNYHINSERIVSRRELMDWFSKVRPEISEILDGPTPLAEAYIKAAFEKITDSALQPHILQSIFGICICDYDLDDEESRMIQLGMTIWGIGLPSFADATP